MKKIKFMQRIENARSAFFDEEPLDTNNFLSFRTEDTHLQSEKSGNCALKNNPLETILKQVLLFFPGTFVLYILSLGSSAAIISGFIRPSGMTLRSGFIPVMFLFLAAALMTWLGLGDVRKPKHFVIPASIISVGIFFGAIAGVLIGVSDQFRRVVMFSDAYPLYIFPLALIIPFLAKGWVDKDS